MAFFENLEKKITQTSQDVVQKAKGTAESMKLNGMIADEQKAVNNLYTKMGKLYFEMHANSYEQPFADMITAVKTSQAKIEQYSEQVKKLKGFITCPNCGNEVQYGMPFCSSCGSRMNVTTDAPVPNNDVPRCSNCGMPIKEGCAFCTNCGTKAEAQPSSSPAAPEASAPAAGGVLCSNCGADMGDNMFCTNCGTKRATDAAPNEQPANRTCPHCHNEIDEDAVFCVNCGLKL